MKIFSALLSLLLMSSTAFAENGQLDESAIEQKNSTSGSIPVSFTIKIKGIDGSIIEVESPKTNDFFQMQDDNFLAVSGEGGSFLGKTIDDLQVPLVIAYRVQIGKYNSEKAQFESIPVDKNGPATILIPAGANVYGVLEEGKPHLIIMSLQYSVPEKRENIFGKPWKIQIP